LLKADFPERYRSMIEYAIRTSVDEASAVPVLTPLVRSGYASTRSSVLEAFWHIGTWSVVPSATAVLTDPDQDTRYYAVRALAAATGEIAWGPSIPEFKDHESKYIQHWVDWAKTHPYTG
jgi:HEAT repeat protein